MMIRDNRIAAAMHDEDWRIYPGQFTERIVPDRAEPLHGDHGNSSAPSAGTLVKALTRINPLTFLRKASSARDSPAERFAENTMLSAENPFS